MPRVFVVDESTFGWFRLPPFYPTSQFRFSVSSPRCPVDISQFALVRELLRLEW